MKVINLILVVLIFCFTSCQKVEIKEDTPQCIEKKIIEFENSSTSCKSGKRVYRYKFQHQFVYVFEPGDCGADMISEVYSEECNLICGLGGIAGNVICSGENFSENAAEKILVWKN